MILDRLKKSALRKCKKTEINFRHGVELKIYPHEVLALIGESGCGKSFTVQTLIGLLPENAYILDGEIILNGKYILKKSKEELRSSGTPLHPYTQLLLKAIPNILNPVEVLESIPGTVPYMINPPLGCRFNPRCPYTMKACLGEVPKLKEVEKEHEVACYLL